MIITYIKWKDALSHEAAGMEPGIAIPELAILNEVGFLLAENEDVVCIGMEMNEGQVMPGRWRLNIPKYAIIERRDVNFTKMFVKPRLRKPKRSEAGLLSLKEENE